MKLSPKQKQAVRLMLTSEKPVMWAGSIRSGKTVGGAAGLVLHAQARPNGQYILAGKSSNSVKRNILPPIRQMCVDIGINYQYRHSDQCCIINDSQVYVFGANNEAAQDYIQGMTADGIFLDELPLLPKSFLMQAIARCSKPDPFMLFTLNKVSPNHWTKTELWDSGEVVQVESMLSDNPHLSDKVIERYEALLTGHYKSRMVDTQWADATGRIWSDIPRWEADLPKMKLVCGVDAAQSGTTASIFLGEADPGTWIIFDEYTYKGLRTFGEHARMIKQFDPWQAHVDPSAPAMINELRKQKIMAIGARTNVVEGLQTVESAINRGKLYVYHAPNLIKEMSGYVWDEKAAAQGEDKPVKKDDHHCDALRYVVMAKIPMLDLRPRPKGEVA